MTEIAPPDVPAEEAERPPSHPGLALVLICIAQLMVVLDATITNIALPRISADLDITGTSLSWVVTGYALAFGGLLLLGGRLGDLYGRRTVFITGLVIFAIASTIGGAAQNEAMLLSSRGFQGLGAALASPAALALITTTFPAGPARNRAFSVFASMAGLGAAIGLILGGWLTDLDPHLGWRLTFLINVPIGLGAALLAPRLLPDSERHSGDLDVPGALVGTFGLLSLVYGITRTGNTGSDGQPNGWGDPASVTFMAIGVVLLLAFVVVERRMRVPMLPLGIFASRQRAVAFVSMMITPAAMFAMFFFLSLYVQNVMGYSPLQTGFAFLPFCVGMIAGATASSKLIARIDPRYIAGIGTLLAAFSLLMFSRLDATDSPAAVVAAATGGDSLGSGVSYWLEIAPFVTTMSIGMGLTFVPMTLVAVHGVRREDAGIGSGVLNTMQQVGGALGLAVLSTIAAPVTSDKVTELMGALQSGGGPAPSGLDPTALAEQAYYAGFSHGATTAFLVGAGMIAVASALIWTLLSVKHTELATDEAPEGVAA